MKPKISIINITVSNLQKSLQFYRDGLGFQTHNCKDGDNYIMFKMEGTWLALSSKDLLAKNSTVPARSELSNITLSHNVVSKEEVDKVFSHAVSVGAKTIKRPQNTEWGGYDGYFADPDGYLWEVAFNPFTDLT